jgi:hypothetical protein
MRQFALQTGSVLLSICKDLSIIFHPNLVPTTRVECRAPHIRTKTLPDGREKTIIDLREVGDADTIWLCTIYEGIGDRTWRNWTEYERIVKASNEIQQWQHIFLHACPTSRGSGCWIEVSIAPAHLFPTNMYQHRIDISSLTFDEDVAAQFE